jgi:hypothetical protein
MCLGRSVLRPARLLALVVVVAFAGESSLARAEPVAATSSLRAPPTPDDVRAAARKFADGERAFRAGDFTRAGQSFDQAYQLAPHEDALWNSANAWQRAGEQARAANLYARYLREAPPVARDRNSATTALAALAAKLGRLDVFAPAPDTVAVDDQAIEGRSVYVNPGVHVVRARRGDRDQQQTSTVRAGQVLSVAFTDDGDKATPAPAPTPALAPAREHVETAPPARGWSPWVVIVEAAVTTGVGAVALASAVDTRNARTSFNDSPTESNLEAGRGKQTRTNVLLAVTGGLALLTVATAIFLVEWRSERRSARIRVGPSMGFSDAGGPSGGAVVSGRF